MQKTPIDFFITHVEILYFSKVIGMKQYEIANHLGNVLTTFTDNKLAVNDGGMVSGYVAQISSSSDYYPFGSLQPGRNFNAGDYRYSFNGKEQDNEIKGTGNSIDFGARIYDSRLGRWMSTDPLQEKYPSLSCYNFCANNPIIYIDPDGKEVTIHDVASYRAVLNTLSTEDMKRVRVKNDGTLKIRGRREGGANLETLRVLVKSDRNYNVRTGTSYISAAGEVTLPKFSSGRTIVPDPKGGILASPDNDVYVLIRPTSETGAPEVVAHELLGHGYLWELFNKGDDSINPWHDYDEVTKKDKNPLTTTEHLWPRVSEARKNVKDGENNDKRKIILDRKVKRFEKHQKK